MKFASRFFLVPFFILIATQSQAGVEWNEPEVVPEKLVRKNRRVLRFSGTTSPNSQLRIKNNRIKLYLDSGKIKKARIPAKNRSQFPLVTDGEGRFSFDLYLPTIAVEIPVQVKERKVWKNFTLNFRVPPKGFASDFEAVEESFRDQEIQVSDIDKDDNYYSSKNDDGQVVRDRFGKKQIIQGNTRAWGGLGLSYFDTSVDSPNNPGLPSTSGSTVVIPTFRLGIDYSLEQSWKLSGAVRSTSGSTDDIGNSQTTGRDFNWLEAQFLAKWFPGYFRRKKVRWALDFGFQLQSVPFFRERPNFTNEAYFDNDIYALTLGAFFEKTTNKMWNYEVYGRFLIPVVTGDSFDVESFPLLFELGGGLVRPLTSGLSMGIFAQLNYFSLDVKYNNVDDIPTDLNLLLFTVDGRLLVHF